MMAVGNSGTTRYLTRTLDSGTLTVQLSESVIDRMNVEVMRGYGATKRRGAEIGGLLIGRLVRDAGDPPLLVIDDYETMPCEYGFGPSWQLSPAEEQSFAAIVEQWKPEPGKTEYAVGLFRSHTRPGLAPDDYDNTIFQRHFAGEPAIVLLIKPYGTRNGVANFFVSRDGKLRTRGETDEFEFTLSGKAPPLGTSPPPERTNGFVSSPVPVAEPDPPAASDPPLELPPTVPEPAAAAASPPPVLEEPSEPQSPAVNAPVRAVEEAPSPTVPAVMPAATGFSPSAHSRPAAAAGSTRPATKDDRLLAHVLGPRELAAPHSDAERSWDGPQFGHYSAEDPSRVRPILLQIAFAAAVFAFGAAAGYQYAGGWIADLAPGRTLPVREPYGIGLTAQRRGEAIALEWNRYSQPIHHASGGALIATEGSASTSIPLSQTELRNGVLLYRTTADQVTFRMEVKVRTNGLVVETATWTRGQ